MGNPLPAGVLDTMAISWASYGPKRGIYRLLDAFKRQGAKASVMVNAVIAERSPEAVKAVAEGGHEVLSHSYAMDVDAGAAERGGRAQEHRALHHAARKRRPAGRSSAGSVPRGTSRGADAADARGGRLPLVRRRVRRRPAVCPDLRQPQDRGDPARHRRERHAVHEIRQRAADDARIRSSRT